MKHRMSSSPEAAIAVKSDKKGFEAYVMSFSGRFKSLLAEARGIRGGTGATVTVDGPVAVMAAHAESYYAKHVGDLPGDHRPESPTLPLPDMFVGTLEKPTLRE